MSNNWIQVVGIYNRVDNSGEFIGIQPAENVNAPQNLPNTQLVISVENEGGEHLGRVPVTPNYGSCNDVVNEGTFQTFIELPINTSVLRLLHDGQQLAIYRAPILSPTSSPESFGLGVRTDHSVPLTQSSSAEPNSTYTVQARERGSSIWQTLDIGLDRPDKGVLDLNQFPGAAVIEVRVLKSSGFKTTEIDRTEIDFTE